MSENAWSPDRPPQPAEQPGTRSGLDLRAQVEREWERMQLTGAPTMSDWLDEVGRHPVAGPSTDEIVRIIRELRDADDPRDVA